MKCPYCNNEFPLTWLRYIKSPTGAQVCPSCGKKSKLPITLKYATLIFLPTVIIVAILMPVLYFASDSLEIAALLSFFVTLIVVTPLDKYCDNRFRKLSIIEENTNYMNSIKNALWCIAILFGLSCLSLLVITGIIVFAFYEDRTKDSGTTTVIVAKQDIKEGTVLETGNLAKKKIRDTKLPEMYVCLHTYKILLGHKLTADVKKEEPIDFKKTDIWIPEKTKMTNPNNTDSPNGGTP
jgi:hypothetical protein